MRDITLEKLYEQLFPKGGKGSKGDFARILGQKQTTICKLTKGEGCTLKSKVWKEVRETVRKNYGYILISKEKTDNEKERVDKKNKQLLRELEKKNAEIAELTKIIEDMMFAQRITRRGRQAMEKGKFIIEKYKNFKEEK